MFCQYTSYIVFYLILTSFHSSLWQVPICLTCDVMNTLVPHVEQDLLTLPAHLRSPLVFGGVCVSYSLVFYVVSCVLLFVCLSFSFLAMVLCLFSIYEFDCPSGIFRPSFIHFNILHTRIYGTLDVMIQLK